MEKFLLMIVAVVAAFVFAMACEAAPREVCLNGICVIVDDGKPTPAAAPQASNDAHSHHAHANGPVRSIVVAPARGAAKAARGTAQVAKGAARGTVKAAKGAGKAIVKVGRKLLPPYCN